MKRVKQFLTWANKKPIRISFFSGLLFIPMVLMMRLLGDTKDFLQDFPNELTWAFASGIALGVVVLVHSLIFPNKNK